MDEARRLLAFDHYGEAAFLGDGFQVSYQDGTATVAAGVGYVGGLRVSLREPYSLPAAVGDTLWIDASWQGFVTGEWNTVFTFCARQEHASYTDGNGFRHFVAPLAKMTGDGPQDLRPETPDEEQSNALAEHEKSRHHPDATLKEKGFAQYSNSTDSDAEDRAATSKAVKAAMDKAKDAVERDGDTMTGELKIRGVNALRIFNEAFGLIFRRSEECLHLIPTRENQGENGDIGPLRPFTINLRTGEISMSHKVSVGGGSQVNGALGIGVQNALGGNSIAFGDNDTGIKQNGDGLLDIYANGQHIFRFQNGTLQSNRAMNTSGRVTPSDYGNFDARYKQRTEGVQDVRYGSEMYYNPGGNQISWTFRSPSGHGLSGINVQETGSNSADNIGGVYYRPLQKLINGTWYNVASV
ncbi:phage tail protein [Escherichia coli]|nr:phage tail protein [Escherichia coli]